MGVNLKFPLRSYRKGFFEMNNTTIDAVKEDIKILLLTKKGERVVNPSIGTNIPILLGELFEPIEKKEMEARIGAEIRSALETWMPYVTMDGIEVFSAVDAPYGTNLNESLDEESKETSIHIVFSNMIIYSRYDLNNV